MKTPLEILAQNPGKVIEMRDDRDATKLLLELGLIDKFMKNPHPGRRWFSMTCTATETHYVVGVVYIDFPEAIDNGYIVNCLPRSDFSEQQALQWALSTYASTCDPATIATAFRSIAKPGEN